MKKLLLCLLLIVLLFSCNNAPTTPEHPPITNPETLSPPTPEQPTTPETPAPPQSEEPPAIEPREITRPNDVPSDSEFNTTMSTSLYEQAVEYLSFVRSTNAHPATRSENIYKILEGAKTRETEENASGELIYNAIYKEGIQTIVANGDVVIGKNTYHLDDFTYSLDPLVETPEMTYISGLFSVNGVKTEGAIEFEELLDKLYTIDKINITNNKVWADNGFTYHLTKRNTVDKNYTDMIVTKDKEELRFGYTANNKRSFYFSFKGDYYTIELFDQLQKEAGMPRI